MRNPIKLPEGYNYPTINIPIELYLDNNLSCVEIFLMKEIYDLHNNQGCFATNQRFADYLGVSVPRVKQIISSLIDRGYLTAEYEYNKNRVVKKRTLIPAQGIENYPCRGIENYPYQGIENYPYRINNIKNTNNIELKFRDTNIDSYNNKDFNSISKKESSVFQRHLAETGYFDLVDIHNKEQLANVLSQVSNLPSTDTLNDYVYTVMSRFADTYKTKRNHRHNKVRYEKLIEYAERLIDIEPMRFDGDKQAYVPAYNRSFSVFELERDELPDFVDGFFDYDLDGCDYSIHVFMKDTILGARFWDIMNKRTKIAL